MKQMFLSVGLLLGVMVTSAVAQDPAPREIKAGILNGKAISLPKPEYPVDAKAAGIEGMVFVDVIIDESGTVVSAVAATDARKSARGKNKDETVEVDVEPADPLLREAAEKAASQARFSPTLLSGSPVKVKGTIVYNFVVRTSDSSVNGGILNSRAASLPMPEYPPAAMAVRAEGTVVVRITIDEAGNVISADAVSGHPLLRAAAVKAARLATFAPTRMEGQPVRVAGVLTYNFVGPKKDDSN